MPNSIESYGLVNLTITPSIQGCTFVIDSPDLLWQGSVDGLSFNFRAPIIYEEKQISFNIKSIQASSQAECTASKSFELTILKNPTKFDINPVPVNATYLATPYFQVHNIGLGGIEITDRYSATICYPTPDDCVVKTNQLFGQDAHNMAIGDFNADGFEDFVVSWALFPHTVEESQKVDAPVNIYLSDGQGGFTEDSSIYASGEASTHPSAYRLVIEDFNGDGIDDIFAGSMGIQVRGEDYTQNYIDPYPHFLLLSNSEGKFVESSDHINDENDGKGLACGFSHDASSGDPDGDGDMDVFTCNMLLINNGQGNFTIHSYVGLEWNHDHLNPMSSLLTDLNNDGFDDLIFWNFDNRHNFEQIPQEGSIFLSDGTSQIQNWEQIDLPAGPFGSNHNKYNHAVAGDLNNDGFIDVVVAVTRDLPYYVGAYVQVLLNDGSGKLVDETATRLPLQGRADTHHGEGNIYLRDMNLDGSLDIIHSTRDFESSFHGAHILINDGQGAFRSVHDSVLPDRPDPGWNHSNSLFKGLPIDTDKTGCLDLVSTVDSWSDENVVRNYLFTIVNLDCDY